MILTCSCCHARYSIDAANQDEAARDLLALKSNCAPQLWNPLIAYLGLFRSESRALAWDRALKLTREVLALDADPATLENALAETVESLRGRSSKPLKNHNYLRRVLETTQAAPVISRAAVVATGPVSKRAAAIEALIAWAGNDWLRCQIANGLTALVARSLKGQPGADIITLCADTWHVSLCRSLIIADVDADRCRQGFERLLARVEEWPQPKQLLDLLPARPNRQSLRAPRPSDEENRTGLAELARLRETL